MKRNGFKTALCTALAGVFALSAFSVTAAAAEVDFDEKVAAAASQAAGDDALPVRYSSRDLGYTSSVKSQSGLTCWAFAGLATMESALLRNSVVDAELSPEHLILWATTRTNGKGWQREFATDGYPVITPGYLTSWQGAVAVSDLTEPLDTETTGDEVPTDLARYGVTGIEYLNKNDPDEIKRCIMNYGGVYTSYKHTSQCQSRDTLSYFMPSDYSGGSGHSIEVVGWDNEYAVDNFATPYGVKPENPGAWLIKNSWGDYNSLGGYFWISYEDSYVFSKTYVPSYSITQFEEITDDKKLIQNEIYGATYEFAYLKNQNQTFLNRLHFDAEYNKIDKVVFKTDAVGAAYSIYYVPDDPSGIPDANTANWTLLYEDTVDYAGYLCADIPDFAYSGSEGSLAVQIDATATSLYSSIGVGEWLTGGGRYVFINESERGESYLYQNGAMTDLMDYYHDELDDDIGGTFVIKAITVKDDSPTLLGDANLDGKVSILDATQIQRHLAEFITLTGAATANADYDGDGAITINDATKIQRFLAEYTD